MGLAASMGAFLLAGGEPGRRQALPNSRIMIHQPSGGMQGTAADIEIQAQEILKMRGRLDQTLAENTGRTLEEIREATDRDRWFMAAEAAEFGIIDSVIELAPRGSKKKA
jgi:ATP-dependent Clp protease protease subunit